MGRADATAMGVEEERSHRQKRCRPPVDPQNAFDGRHDREPCDLSFDSRLDREAASQPPPDGCHVGVAVVHEVIACLGVASSRRFGRATAAATGTPLVQGIDGTVGKNGCQFRHTGANGLEAAPEGDDRFVPSVGRHEARSVAPATSSVTAPAWAGVAGVGMSMYDR